MKKKYIFITGGVVSSLGKGVASASIGALLQSHGYSVKNRKFDPYLNIDPAHLSPLEHGEIYITSDGYLTDLDVGYYERFLNRQVNKTDSVSGGKIYWEVLNKERSGEYGEQTVQMVPHVSNAIKDHIKSDPDNYEFNIYEIGGTVGDIEGLIFLEAIRQFANEQGRENCMFIHLTLIPYLPSAKELKTKPTQNSVRELLEKGIQADMLLCRSSIALSENDKNKISLFCNVKKENVITSLDLDNIYKIPLYYKEEKLDKRILDYFKMGESESNLSHYEKIKDYCDKCHDEITIAVIGNYFKTADSYKSLNESLFHGGLQNNVKVKTLKLDTTLFESQNDENFFKLLENVKGILLPADNEDNGGKTNAIKYAIKNDIPLLGIGFIPTRCMLDAIDEKYEIKKEEIKGEKEIVLSVELQKLYGKEKIKERFNISHVFPSLPSQSFSVCDKRFCHSVMYLPEYNSTPFSPNKLVCEFINECKK